MGNINKIISEAMGTVRKVIGVRVKYGRKSRFFHLTAVAGSTTYESQTTDGTVLTKTRDYIVSVCDLVLDDVQVTPQKGDTITERVGPKLFVYTVSDSGEQAWSYSDTGRTHIRIHTHQTGELDA